MNFTSQICTTKEQSERLLALGLKKETADMVLLKELAYDEELHRICDAGTYMIRPIDYLDGEEHREHIPAWSLHRLIEIYGVRNIMLNLEVYDSIYDQIIHRIKISINSGTLDKEYLEE